MSLIARIAGGLVALMIFAVVALAIALAHDSPAGPLQPPPPGAVRMKAILYRRYGPPETLKLEEIEKPAPAPNELLIRVHDAALNPLDWHYMRGTPYIVRLQLGMGRPRRYRLGEDFSGTVAAIGPQISHFKVGDEIFGTADGALGEYATSTEAGLAVKPAGISFAQAAAVPIAGLTALQGLRDYGHLAAGQRVLINGASGGVGTFAIQIARSFGADVTGVCSTRNVELVRGLGAGRVIDYSKEDFTTDAQKYDLIFDTIGNHSLGDYDRMLTPGGVVVMVGSPSYEPWLGPLVGLMKTRLMSPFLRHPAVIFFADANNTADLETLRDLMQAGRLVPVIDRSYPLSESAAAMRYLEQGHARGKVIVGVQ